MYITLRYYTIQHKTEYRKLDKATIIKGPGSVKCSNGMYVAAHNFIESNNKYIHLYCAATIIFSVAPGTTKQPISVKSTCELSHRMTFMSRRLENIPDSRSSRMKTVTVYVFVAGTMS